MLKKSYSPTSLNNKGMAVLEIIPIITVIVLLLNFSIGFLDRFTQAFYNLFLAVTMLLKHSLIDLI